MADIEDDSSNPLTVWTDSSSSSTSVCGGSGGAGAGREIELPRQAANRDSIVVDPRDFQDSLECEMLTTDDASMIAQHRLENSKLYSKSYPLMNPGDYEIQDSTDSQKIHKLQNLHNREINSCIGLLSSIQHKVESTKSKSQDSKPAKLVDIFGNNVKVAAGQYKQILLDSKIMTQRPVVLLNRLAKRAIISNLASKSTSKPSSKQTIYLPSLGESSAKKSSHSSLQNLKKEQKLKTSESKRHLSSDGTKRDETRSRTQDSANGHQPMSQTKPKTEIGSSKVRLSKSTDRINDPKATETKVKPLQSSTYTPKPTALSAKKLDKPDTKKALFKSEKPKDNILGTKASSQSSLEKSTKIETIQQSQPQTFKIPKLNTKQTSELESQSKIVITKINNKKSTTSKSSKESETTNLKRSLEPKSSDMSKKLKVTTAIPTTNVKPETAKPKENVVDKPSVKPPVDPTPTPVAQSSPTLVFFDQNYPEFSTLSEHVSRCGQFNESISVNESFYLLFLMEAYKRKLHSFTSIDSDTLIKAISDFTGFDRMTPSQIGLLHSLFSKSLNRINNFHLFNHDSSLREYSSSYKEFLQSTWKDANNRPLGALVEQLNPQTSYEAFLSKLDQLTPSENYILSSRLDRRLIESYRSVRLEPLDGTDFHTLKIQFENNMIVESEDSSIEASVLHVLHFTNSKEFNVLRSLNKSLIIKPLNGSIHLNLNSYGNVQNKVNDAQLVDSVFVERRTNRIIQAFHTDKLSILEIHKTNYTTVNKERVRGLSATNIDNQAPRFVQHLSMIKSQRGLQRRAEVHKMLSQDECDQKLKKLRSEKNIVIDKN